MKKEIEFNRIFNEVGTMSDNKELQDRSSFLCRDYVWNEASNDAEKHEINRLFREETLTVGLSCV